jgi:predicted MFS family arabinose efflux permease
MKTQRIAVAAFFFANGFLYSNWTARLPEFQQKLGVNDAVLGSLLFLIALGAIIAMPFSGWFTTRLGSRRPSIIMGLLFCAVLALVPVFQQLWLVSLVFIALGISTGSMDVAMNGQAILVERLFQRPINASFHATFSIGMALGAGSGALVSRFGIPLQLHLPLMSGLVILLLLWASTHLVRDEPEPNEAEESHFRWPSRAILPLGLIAFCCMCGEGSMVDWSAQYMNKVVGKSEDFSALAFACFGIAMTIGRIFGDYTTQKLGPRQLLLIDASLTILGLSLALGFPSVLTTFIGFFLAGLGFSTIIPLVFSRAGNLRGDNPAAGIAMASTVGYAGFFVGPPSIGYLSALFGLRVGLCFTLGLCVLMMVIIPFAFNKKTKS